MVDKNKINEQVPDSIETDAETYKGIKDTIDPKTKVKITGLKPLNKPNSNTSNTSSYATSTMTETDELIEPKDKPTIKYLSNVKDTSTGEVSQPFTIDGKKYEMVRGKLPSREVVLGVYCHDEINENGDNVIYSVEDFDRNIATPMKERAIMQEKERVDNENKAIEAQLKKQEEEKKQKEIEDKELEDKEKSGDGFDSLNLSQSKHYIVNQKTGKFKKFKTIEEVASAVMGKDEKYMGLKAFKKFFEDKVFGSPSKNSNSVLEEMAPTGVEDENNDEEMSFKAKKLMKLISTKIPANVINTIKTPVARREVIAAFAELIGVPRQGLSNLILSLKDISKQPVQGQGQGQGQAPVQESKLITKDNFLKTDNVIKIVKVKDINNE